MTERCVVDNRVLLLGLDELYRDAMKRHERGELLACARRVSKALDAAPANVPVEGYYSEDEELTEYFLLVRSLQDVDESAASSVDALPKFQRLRDVTSAPLYGRPQLPSPDPAHAGHYWHAYEANEILGRCVRLGYDGTNPPIRHYHWAICRAPLGEFVVQEFWNSEVWSTTRYRSALRGWRCPEL